MIELAKETEIERKINVLIQRAWNFGVACADDRIESMAQSGDSYIEMLRGDLDAAKNELYLLMLKEVE